MKVDALVPKVYYKESRDFSYIGRIFEVLLNYMKTNADLINASLDSDNIKALLTDLLVTTLGFESKHDYITKDLIYIASSFSNLLRKKGTWDSIFEAIEILLTSQSIDIQPVMKVDNDDEFQLNIVIPTNMTDVVLLEDLLDYILPAGWIVVIRRGEPTEVDTPTVLNIKDGITSYVVQDAGDINGLGNVYNQPKNEIDEPEYEFQGFLNNN